MLYDSLSFLIKLYDSLSFLIKLISLLLVKLVDTNSKHGLIQMAQHRLFIVQRNIHLVHSIPKLPLPLIPPLRDISWRPSFCAHYTSISRSIGTQNNSREPPADRICRSRCNRSQLREFVAGPSREGVMSSIKRFDFHAERCIFLYPGFWDGNKNRIGDWNV